ncbi:hypothetical protein CHARACLAT_019255 [Characodon lateralis]|uniref:Uncharacterized protein n=1 Tax=Characodon lateralis TaxID=208331 RepID=A0ABU7E2B7_9TELE|nr:hypothetical protein [Characodon lateralis]
MTTEYHDEVEDDINSFWNKEPRPISFSGVPRFRRWLYPGLGVSFVLIFIIAVGVTTTEGHVYASKHSGTSAAGAFVLM